MLPFLQPNDSPRPHSHQPVAVAPPLALGLSPRVQSRLDGTDVGVITLEWHARPSVPCAIRADGPGVVAVVFVVTFDDGILGPIRAFL